MTTERERAFSGRLAGLIILLGGLVLVSGSLMTWLSVRFSHPLSSALDSSTRGVDIREGRVVLACGILALVVGAVTLARESRFARELATAALLSGAVGAFLPLYDMATKQTQIENAFRQGLQEATHRTISDQQFEAVRERLEAFGLESPLGPGVYVAVLGGLLTATGGVVALASGTRSGSGGPSDPETPEPD